MHKERQRRQQDDDDDDEGEEESGRCVCVYNNSASKYTLSNKIITSSLIRHFEMCLLAFSLKGLFPNASIILLLIIKNKNPFRQINEI